MVVIEECPLARLLDAPTPADIDLPLDFARFAARLWPQTAGVPVLGPAESRSPIAQSVERAAVNR